MKPVLVSIICDVFNHGPYLRQTLEGFLSQKTDFGFEVLIHDDASTDDSPDIIRAYAEKYPEVIRPVLQTENQYSQGVSIWFTWQLPRAQGRYVALCEGDDYWNDPLKLQKQVDYLEKHPDCGLVYTSSRVFHQHSGSFAPKLMGEDVGGIDGLFIRNKIPTATTCFRTSYFRDYIAQGVFQRSWKMGDFPLWLYIASRSRLHFIDEPTATYRVLGESASHTADYDRRVAFICGTFDIQRYFMERLHKEYLLDKVVYKNFKDWMKAAAGSGRKVNPEEVMRRFGIARLGVKSWLKYYWYRWRYGI